MLKTNIKDAIILSLMAALMFVSKIVMEFLPNVHLIGVFIVAITVVYRYKALYAIYTFVFLTGLVYGFQLWWIPYLYIWTVLWTMVMLLPKNMPKKIAPIIYMVVCSLHGFLYGTLYAPLQAIMFGLDFKGMVAWIIAGIPWDVTHGISNLVCGSLIMPIILVLRGREKYAK